MVQNPAPGQDLGYILMPLWGCPRDRHRSQRVDVRPFCESCSLVDREMDVSIESIPSKGPAAQPEYSPGLGRGLQCRERELNPHESFPPRDFKSPASTCSAIPAWNNDGKLPHRGRKGKNSTGSARARVGCRQGLVLRSFSEVACPAVPEIRGD